MRSLALRLAALAAALAVLSLGVYGAARYASDYDDHRGFTELAQLPRAGTGRLEDVHFFSRALHRQADYLIYLPPGYHPASRYPAYYLLHGMPGKPAVWVDIANMDVRLDNQIYRRRARPMILVYPDGRIAGSTYSDSEWANTPSGAFESYVMEVVAQVDEHFAAIPDRDARVIGGFSAGAYGALNIGLHHLAQFADIQSWSGYDVETRTGVFAHASRALLAANSPIDEVGRLRAQLRREPLRVDSFVGRDDADASQQAPMDAALRAEGAVVHDAVYPGGHDWAVWYPRLNAMLDLASADVSRPLTVAARSAATATPAPAASAAGGPSGRATQARAKRRAPTRRSWPALLAALALALLSAALIGLGFVLQHRGHARAAQRGATGPAAAFATPTWLAGQAIGWTGFGGSVIALGLAPLTLVQAFAAGGLALAVPLAARIFRTPVTRTQLAAIGMIAVGLVSLPVGYASGHADGLRPGALLAAAFAVAFAALALARSGRVVPRAIAAGALYGVADAAIKADALALRHHGASGLVSGWTLLAALATLGGFLCLQAALRGRDAVTPITLTNAFTAVTAIALGIGGFGERLGSSPAASVAHAFAIGLVLVCVRPLAGAQGELARSGEACVRAAGGAPGGARAPRLRLRPALRLRLRPALRELGAVALALAVTVIGCLAGTGILYLLREWRLLAAGVRVGDSLPLLQLAGFAGQPLTRVLGAWLAVGIACGVLLVALAPGRRLALVTAFGALTLLLASDACAALADNLRLGTTLLHAAPGMGPWLECLALAAGATLVGPLRAPRRPPARGGRAAGPADPLPATPLRAVSQP